MSNAMLGPSAILTSIESEQAALGSVLIAPEAYYDISHLLAPDCFSQHKHRWLWEAMVSLSENRIQIDVTTLSNELERRGQLAEFGGMAYMARLLNSVPTSMHAVSYARLVAQAAQRRRLLESASVIANLAADESIPVETAFANSRAALLTAEGETAGDVVSAKQAVGEWYDSYSDFLKNGTLPGLTTGYPRLDRATNGMRRGEMLILAGRPGMGKTSLAAQVSARQARAGMRVGVVTLEEHYKTWAGIAIGAEAGQDLSKREGGDIDAIAARASQIHDLPLAFNARGGRKSIGAIEHDIRRAAAALGGLDVIWLDHLGYIDHAAGRNQNTAYAIGVITKSLITLVKEFNAALGVLCQLSRESARAGRPPELVDLRDSGEIEQDARQVWMIHTPGYYAESKPADDKPQESILYVRKNSNGPTGKVSMAFVANSRRFAEMI